MKRFLPLIFLIVFLAACSPSESQIQTTVAETEAAVPTATSAMPPTVLPTEIPTEVPTATPTNTPEPTPDPRVIDTQPRLIILTEEEIDPIADYGMFGSVPAYALYDNVINPYANLACSLGFEEATRVLDETGLVTGWTTQYIWGKNFLPQPSHIEFSPLVFDSIEGPTLWMDRWETGCEYDFYTYVSDLEFGEKSTLCVNLTPVKFKDQDATAAAIRLAIKYKNILLSMKASGLEGSFDLDLIYRLASRQMEKLASLDLVDSVSLPVDFSPGVGCSTPPTPSGSNTKASPELGETIGWCVPKRVNGVLVCWGPCLLSCSAITPEGEKIHPDDCIPCVKSMGIGEKIDINN